jgi:hypothetical protein
LIAITSTASRRSTMASFVAARNIGTRMRALSGRRYPPAMRIVEMVSVSWSWRR